MEISKTQILHENINKSGYKNLKNERLCKNERYAHYLQLYCAEQGKLFDYDLWRNPAIKILNKTRFVKN
ncbi:hypothetical protein HpSLK40_10260 [Helicobacter pylori]